VHLYSSCKHPKVLEPRADLRLPSHAAETAPAASHCPQLSPGLSSASVSTQRPSHGTDPAVLRFGDTGDTQHIRVNPTPVRVATRGGYAALASVKFNQDPSSAGANFAVLALRVQGSGTQSILLHTDSAASGVLKAGLCEASTCVFAASASAPPRDTWLTVALRYTAAAARLELWVDLGNPNWAGLQSYFTTVRFLSGTCPCSVGWILRCVSYNWSSCQPLPVSQSPA